MFIAYMHLKAIFVGHWWSAPSCAGVAVLAFLWWCASLKGHAAS